MKTVVERHLRLGDIAKLWKIIFSCFLRPGRRRFNSCSVYFLRSWVPYPGAHKLELNEYLRLYHQWHESDILSSRACSLNATHFTSSPPIRITVIVLDSKATFRLHVYLLLITSVPNITVVNLTLAGHASSYNSNKLTNQMQQFYKLLVVVWPDRPDHD
jgi:hypothetical protein